MIKQKSFEMFFLTPGKTGVRRGSQRQAGPTGATWTCHAQPVEVMPEEREVPLGDAAQASSSPMASLTGCRSFCLHPR